MRISRIELAGEGAADSRVGTHRSKRLSAISWRLDGVDGDLTDVGIRRRGYDTQSKDEDQSQLRERAKGYRIFVHDSPSGAISMLLVVACSTSLAVEFCHFTTKLCQPALLRHTKAERRAIGENPRISHLTEIGVEPLYGYIGIREKITTSELRNVTLASARR
jgi:hypothetical protein